MTEAPGVLSQKLAKTAIIHLLENMDTHPIRSAEGFRNAAIDGWLAFNPMLDTQLETETVNRMVDAIQTTILEGRMIDFGFIPNAILKETSTKTREIFEAGELQHPYQEWIGVSSWEGGMCGYYFFHAPEGTAERSVMCVEIYGVNAPALPPSVVINDIVYIDIDNSTTMIQPVQMLSPRFNTLEEVQKRGANLLDPLVTFLRLLSDATVPIIDVPAPVKLNKQRALKGKSLIPAHTRVETRDYVSLFQAHKEGVSKGGPKGGHHASPIPHWRRSHQRHLVSGKVIPVRSTKVNWRDTNELHRLFSRVKKVTP